MTTLTFDTRPARRSTAVRPAAQQSAAAVDAGSAPRRQRPWTRALHWLRTPRAITMVAAVALTGQTPAIVALPTFDTTSDEAEARRWN